MIRSYLKKNLDRMRNDEGISPVIGTILMVAATVIIGGAVYAAVNAYSGKAAKQATDAAFKAQGIDTDGDGKEDTMKLTYLAGPSGAEPKVVVSGASWGAGTNSTLWNPGDFSTYSTAGDSQATVFVTVSLAESTILDQTLTLKE